LDPAVATNEPALTYGVADHPAIRSWRDGEGLLKILLTLVLAAPAIVTLLIKIIPLLLITALAQGIITGDVLRRLFVRLDLRNGSIAKVAGISAGVLGVAFFHSAIYFRDVWDIANLADRHGALSVVRDMAAAGNVNPYAVVSLLAKRRTGHGGTLVQSREDICVQAASRNGWTRF
jgi:hypothetical protein